MFCTVLEVDTSQEITVDGDGFTVVYQLYGNVNLCPECHIYRCDGHAHLNRRADSMYCTTCAKINPYPNYEICLRIKHDLQDGLRYHVYDDIIDMRSIPADYDTYGGHHAQITKFTRNNKGTTVFHSLICGYYIGETAMEIVSMYLGMMPQRLGCHYDQMKYFNLLVDGYMGDLLNGRLSSYYDDIDRYIFSAIRFRSLHISGPHFPIWQKTYVAEDSYWNGESWSGYVSEQDNIISTLVENQQRIIDNTLQFRFNKYERTYNPERDDPTLQYDSAGIPGEILVHRSQSVIPEGILHIMYTNSLWRPIFNMINDHFVPYAQFAVYAKEAKYALFADSATDSDYLRERQDNAVKLADLVGVDMSAEAFNGHDTGYAYCAATAMFAFYTTSARYARSAIERMPLERST
jgi:hypothetical protein